MGFALTGIHSGGGGQPKTAMNKLDGAVGESHLNSQAVLAELSLGTGTAS